MKYKNSRTGVVIDTPCFVKGGNWKAFDETVEDAIPTNESEERPVESVQIDDETNESNSGGVTRKEIMQELDAMGIKYDAKAKKDDLYKLMIGE